MRDAAIDASDRRAYSFLGLVKGHKDFLQHIPKAVRSLCNVVAKIDNLKPLESFLDGIC